MKVRTTLVLTFIVISSLSIILFSILVSSNTTADSKQKFDDYIEALSENQINNLELYLDDLSALVVRLAQNYELKAFVGEIGKASQGSAYADMEQVMKSYISEGAPFTGITVFDANNGTVYYQIGVEILTAPQQFKQVLEMEDYSYYCHIQTHEVNKSEYYLYTKAKLDNDTYLLCALDCSKLQQLVKLSEFSGNGRTMLVDPEMCLIDLVFVGDLTEIYMPEYHEIKNRLLENDKNATNLKFEFAIGKSARVAHIESVYGTGWRVVTVSETAQAATFSSKVGSVMTTLTWIVCILFAALSVLFAFVFTKPLYEIEETLVKLRRGNHEVRMNVIANNEYGQIASAFNDLLDNFIVSEVRYRTIIEMSDNIIFEWNFDTSEVVFSNNFNKKFSYRAPSDRYEDSFLVKCKVHPDDAKRYNQDLAELAQGKVFTHREYRWKNIYGDYIWVLMRTSTITDREGRIIKVVGVVVDIDRAKKSEKILTTRASYDALTGLFNRETVESLINNEIELISVRKNQFAILFIDVDDFKHFNDDYSHATGDQVLKFTADIINSIVSEFGIAGRYGGDEFVVCVRNSDVNDPARIAQEMLDQLKAGFNCDVGEQLVVNVSIGIAIIKDSSRRVDQIIGMADDAMYKIKKSGKSNYGFI